MFWAAQPNLVFWATRSNKFPYFKGIRNWRAEGWHIQELEDWRHRAPLKWWKHQGRKYFKGHQRTWHIVHGQHRQQRLLRLATFSHRCQNY